MLKPACTLLLAAATLLPGVCCTANTGIAPDASVLHPINLRDYESAVGLRRRSEEAFTDLDPSTQSQLIYGRPGGAYLDVLDFSKSL